MSDVKSSGSATIAERVHAVIRHVLALETDAVAGTSRLKEDLGADSVDAGMTSMSGFPPWTRWWR
jgi:acyl carrier protein